jgi:hypothetical protein
MRRSFLLTPRSYWRRFDFREYFGSIALFEGELVMGPSQNQLRLLSAEDRVLYKKWLRGGLLFYGSAMAALVLAAVGNHMVTSAPSGVADEPVHTAAIVSKK